MKLLVRIGSRLFLGEMPNLQSCEGIANLRCVLEIFGEGNGGTLRDITYLDWLLKISDGSVRLSFQGIELVDSMSEHFGTARSARNVASD